MAGFFAVNDIYFVKTVRGTAAVKKTSAGILSHPPFDVLSQVLTVEFIDGLNHPFQ